MIRRYPFVFVFFVTALCICSAYYLHIPWNLRADTEIDYLDSVAIFRVHVLEPPESKPSAYKLSVRLLSMQQPSSDSIRQLSQHAILSLRDDSVNTFVPQAGDILLARTRITRPHALFAGDFDYGNYLRLHHQAGVGYVIASQCSKVGNVPVRGLRVYAGKIQHRLVQRYTDAGLSGRSLAFVSAITLGEKDELDSSLRQSFAAAGAAHVLAVSGLHTGIIYLVVFSLFTFFGLRRPLYEQRLRRALLSAAILLVMWLYAFVTGLSPSVLRAVLMLSIVEIGWVLRRESISLNTVAAAACVCLWAEPMSLFNVSFQLSFSAVAGIMLFVPYMNEVWHVKGNKLRRWLRDTITVSLGAMIGTLPVTLYHFGQVAHYFLLANVVVLPSAFVLVVMGLLTLVFAHTIVGTWIALALQAMSSWVCSYVQWIEHLPHATLQLFVTPWMVVCLVVCIACCYLRIKRQKLVWFVPGVAAIALFCVLHVFDVKRHMQEQTFAVYGRTLYYRHGYTTETYPLESRYTFFRFGECDYVYAPYLSLSKQRALQEFCAQQGIAQIDKGNP